MFEIKDVISDAVNRTLALFRQQQRGDVVAWESTEAISGLQRQGEHWNSFMKRFRRDFMNETGIALWPVNGVGLQLLTKEDQIKLLPIWRSRRAHRQHVRTLTALQAMPDDDLTMHQRGVKWQQIEQIRRAKRADRNAIRLGHILAKPSSGGIPHGRPLVGTN